MKKLLLLSAFLVGSLMAYQSAAAQYRGNTNMGTPPKGGSTVHGNNNYEQQGSSSQGHGQVVNNDNRGDYNDHRGFDERNRGRDEDSYYNRDNRRQDHDRGDEHDGYDNHRRGGYNNYHRWNDGRSYHNRGRW